MNISWDASDYKQSFSFVSEYGKGVVDLISAPAGSSCLDLGCGNGSLTAELSSRGYNVCGLDASPDMLELARKTYLDLQFIESDATSFQLSEPVDVVFSNAMLHWVEKTRQPEMLACVARALKPGGQFVFECGGFGCCERIHEALAHAFADRGLGYEVPFFFPTIGEYAPLLEAAGLRPDTALLFDRPTRLAGPDGMRDWIHMFAKRPFEGMDAATAQDIVGQAVDELRSELFHDGAWWADYVRLRMRATRVA